MSRKRDQSLVNADDAPMSADDGRTNADDAPTSADDAPRSADGAPSSADDVPTSAVDAPTNSANFPTEISVPMSDDESDDDVSDDDESDDDDDVSDDNESNDDESNYRCRSSVGRLCASARLTGTTLRSSQLDFSASLQQPRTAVFVSIILIYKLSKIHDRKTLFIAIAIKLLQSLPGCCRHIP